MDPQFGSQFFGFSRAGHDFVDMYLYGNYFALTLFVYMLIILSRSQRLRFLNICWLGLVNDLASRVQNMTCRELGHIIYNYSIFLLLLLLT